MASDKLIPESGFLICKMCIHVNILAGELREVCSTNVSLSPSLFCLVSDTVHYLALPQLMRCVIVLSPYPHFTCEDPEINHMVSGRAGISPPSV